MPAAKKFTANNVPALIRLAIECGLEHTMSGGRRGIDFSAQPAENGEFCRMREEDEGKLKRFIKRAEEMFGDREHFTTCNRWSFVRCDWSKECRTQSQMDNVD
jgi:hypothetical protein